MSLNDSYKPQDGGFYEAFTNIDVKKTGLWARWLWPDAVEEAELDRELKALAEAGFAGVEIGLAASGTIWGTDEYFTGLILAMRAAKKYGLRTDFFITVGTICLPQSVLPLDSDAAEKILHYYDTPVTVSAGSDGRGLTVTLGRPAKSKTTINARLIGVSYARVESREDNKVFLSQAEAGILYEDGLHIDTYVPECPYTLWGLLGKKSKNDLKAFGYNPLNHKFDMAVLEKNPALLSVNLDLPANPGNEDADYIVFAYWEIPSDKTFGGAVQYCADHYSLLGTKAVTDCYDRAVEKFPELGQLFKEVGRAWFGDSLENYGNWTMEIPGKYYELFGSDITPYLFTVATPEWAYKPEMPMPLFAAPSPDIKKGAPLPPEPKPDMPDGPFPFFGRDADKTSYVITDGNKIKNSYYQAMTKSFIENHILAYQHWADKYGMDVRYQSTYGQKQFMAQASAYIDIAETESLAYNDQVDGYRGQAGAVHMSRAGSGILSSEQGETKQTWFHSVTWGGDFLWRTNRFYVAGGNQLVYHVYAYTKYDPPMTFNNSNMVWPGFRPQPHVGDNLQRELPTLKYMGDYSKYIARAQLLLRSGEARLDCAIYFHSYNNDRWDFDAFYKDDSLEKTGYSYEFIDPSFFDFENALVSNGIFAKNGPGYRAFLFKNQETLPLEAAEKLLQYAKAGLPMVFAGKLPTTPAYFRGIDETAQDAARIGAIVDALKTLPNVRFVADASAWPEALADLGVAPSLNPDGAAVMYAHRADSQADYYYVYNQNKYYGEDMWTPLPETGGLFTFRSEKKGRKPYLLNLWSGTIEPLAAYTENADGSVSVYASIPGNDTFVLALADELWRPEKLPAVRAEAEASGTTIRYSGGGLALRAMANGTYAAEVNGETKTVSVLALPEAQALESWRLTLLSYSPGDKAYSGDDLTDTKKEVVFDGPIGKTRAWNSLGLLPNGESAANISGIGTYKTELLWDPALADGAYLDLGRVCDLYKVTVNGAEVPGANPVTPVLDIGPWLKAGHNSVTVEVASNLFNAQLSRGYLDCNWVEPVPWTPTEFGILESARLVYYRDIKL